MIEGHTPLSKEIFWKDSIFVLPENDTVEAAHNVPWWVKKMPLFVGVIGIALAYLAYMFATGIPGVMVKVFKPLHRLFFRKWFFDELYERLFVRSSVLLGRLFWRVGDQGIVDRYGPDGVSALSRNIGAKFGAFQTGYVYKYAFVTVIAVVVILSWFMFKDVYIADAPALPTPLEGGQ